MTDPSKEFDDLYITCKDTLEVQGFDTSDYSEYDYFFVQQIEMKIFGFFLYLMNCF